MARTSDPRTYTDPDLRERLKREITAGDRGGRPGQWSARKAQLLAAEYKKAGGGYRTDKEHEPAPARHLDQWTDEEWQTQEGEAQARDGDETRRYLPKEAWEQLSPQEKRETESAKREGARHGQQYVANPPAAKRARARASHDGDGADGGDGGGDGGQPLPSYDELTVAEVRERLDDLDAETVRAVRDYERDHKARRTLLPALERAAGKR